MAQELERLLHRIQDDAQDIMDNAPSAKVVLDSMIMEIGPLALAYKMKGTIPSIQALTSAATKLVAIIAATHEARTAEKATKTPIPMTPLTNAPTQAGGTPYAAN